MSSTTFPQSTALFSTSKLVSTGDQFNSINLNSYQKASDVITIQNTSSKVGKHHTFDDNAIIEKKQWREKPEKHPFWWLNLHDHYLNKKKSQGELRRSASTLSKHIACYEASIECVENEVAIDDEELKAKKQSLFRNLIEKIKIVFANSPVVLSSQTVPAQNNEDTFAEPLIHAFKAGDRLLAGNGQNNSVTPAAVLKRIDISHIKFSGNTVFAIRYSKDTYKNFNHKIFVPCNFGYIVVQKDANDKNVIWMYDENASLLGFSSDGSEDLVNQLFNFEGGYFQRYDLQSYKVVTTVEEMSYKLPDPEFVEVRLFKTKSHLVVYHHKDNIIRPTTEIIQAFESDYRFPSMLLPFTKRFPRSVIPDCDVLNQEPWLQNSFNAFTLEWEYEARKNASVVPPSQQRYDDLYGEQEEEMVVEEDDKDDQDENVVTGDFFTVCSTLTPTLKMISVEQADFISICLIAEFSDGIYSSRVGFSMALMDKLIEDRMHKIKNEICPIIKVNKMNYGQYQDEEIPVIEEYDLLSHEPHGNAVQQLMGEQVQTFIGLFKQKLSS